MEKISFDIILSLKDKVSKALGNIHSAFKEVNKEAKKATRQSEKFGNICSKLKFPNLDAIINVVERFSDGMAHAIDKSISFEQSIADLSSITGIAGKELESLEENARKFGESSGLGASTASRAYSILASQIQVADIGMDGLNNLLNKSITLAHASGMSMDASAEALAATINQFGLGAEQADRVINVLAAGSKYGAAEISELSQSFKVVGASASAMGLNVEETAGALEVLSKANLKGSEAGTALRNIILKLNTELGIDLGETSLDTALGALQPKLTDATYLSKVFGMENLAAAQFLIQNANAVGQMTAQLTGTNVAQEQAATRTATNSQKLAEYRAWLDNVKISLTEMSGILAPFILILSENAGAIVASMKGISVFHIWLIKANKAFAVLTGSTLTHTVATKAAAAATAVWKGIQMAFNAVLSANPIAMVIMALGTLAAAVVYCYNHFDGFRAVCDKVWGAVKNVADAVWDSLVKAFEKASAVIKAAWQWVKKFFGISDDSSIQDTTQSLNEQTQAVQENAKAKQNMLKLDFSKSPGKTGNGPSSSNQVGAKGSISWLDNEINLKEKEFKLAINNESRRRILAELDGLEQEKRTIELNLEFSKPVSDERQRGDMQGLKKDFKDMKGNKDAIQPKSLNVDHKYFNTYEAAIENARKAQERFQSGAGAVADVFGNIGNAIGGAAGQWLQYGANLVNTVAQSVPAITQLIASMTSETAVTQAKTQADVQSASAAAMKAHAGIPFVGVAMGVAAVAAIIAAMLSIPKFEQGGIVGGSSFYGDRLLARVNSGEMILNRKQQAHLYGMVGGSGTMSGRTEKVEFRIAGRYLKGVLERENNLNRRS